jgi:Fe-S oxidoreductase
MIDRWADFASIAPGMVNFLNGAPGFKQVLRWALHLAPERTIPRFAPYTFQQWARRHGVRASGGNVILWPDTFNNYFHTAPGEAAYEVLQAAGFNVCVPAGHFCCGRPLYDFGMIDRARSYLQNILDEFGGPIDSGVPIVVLEPSCASVFRDELAGLFPSDARAKRLRNQTFVLSEFLERQGSDYTPPSLDCQVLLHGHCHQKAILKMTDEETLLRRMGVALQVPDAGCCGMAGPFGFEKNKYAVSRAVGERVLLPAVRAADPSTLIVADGFSCKEQILQGTGRNAIHLAELLQRGLRAEVPMNSSGGT